MKTTQQPSIATALPTRAAPAALVVVMACTISLAAVASQIVPLAVGA